MGGTVNARLHADNASIRKRMRFTAFRVMFDAASSGFLLVVSDADLQRPASTLVLFPPMAVRCRLAAGALKHVPH